MFLYSFNYLKNFIFISYFINFLPYLSCYIKSINSFKYGFMVGDYE